VEVERAKGRGCLTRTVKLALLVRQFGFSAKRRDNRLVGRTVARVSVEEHMANYQAARALLGKGKKGAKKSAAKNGAKGMSDMAG
jgi:hypothetical protein